MLIHRLIKRALRKPEDGGEGGAAGGSGPSGQTVDQTPAEGTSGGAAGEGGGSGQPGDNAGAAGEGNAGEASGAEAEETVLRLGDEEVAAAEEAAPWLKNLRKRFREQERELAGYRRGNAPTAGAAGIPPAPGKKPAMNDPEIDYDSDKFAVALEKWHEASAKHNDAKRRLTEQQEQEQRTWQQTVKAFESAGAKLGFSDYQECHDAAMAGLSETQAAIIVQGCDSAEKAALVMYALGRNMKLLQELADVADPVKFAFKVASIQGRLNVLKRKPSTTPETRLPNSSASTTAGLTGDDKKLEALREEAQKTGDLSKVLAFKREMTQRAAAGGKR